MAAGDRIGGWTARGDSIAAGGACVTPLISIVVPVYNEFANLEPFFARLNPLPAQPAGNALAARDSQAVLPRHRSPERRGVAARRRRFSSPGSRGAQPTA